MLSNAAVSNVKKLNSALQQLREHHEDSELFSDPDEFDPSPTNALGIRAHTIQKMNKGLSFEALTNYLRGLGYVREQLIAARDVLNAKGKKKYESYIKSAVETLPAQLKGLSSQHMGILTNLITVVFRRSAERDRRELSDSLCLIADYIEKYRYHATDERYREYARTIINGIDTEQLPPMISGLVIHELVSLVEAALSTDVQTFARSGITHEEYWRYIDPKDYAETYPNSEIPEDASPLECLDIYSPQLGIARQCMWYGFDIYVDDFIVSLAGGLLYTKSL